jgi:hypothetical protein
MIGETARNSQVTWGQCSVRTKWRGLLQLPLPFSNSKESPQADHPPTLLFPDVSVYPAYFCSKELALTAAHMKHATGSCLAAGYSDKGLARVKVRCMCLCTFLHVKMEELVER